MVIEHDELTGESARIVRIDRSDRGADLRVRHVARVSIVIHEQNAVMIGISFMQFGEIGAVERQYDTLLAQSLREHVAIGGSLTERVD